ncbi:complement receptor type 1 [Caloenas nicobarica]
MVLAFALRLLGSSALLLATAAGAQAAQCRLPRILYGKVVSATRSPYKSGDTVSFVCNTGYTLQGSHRSTCQDNSRWSPPLPVCKKEVTCPRPPNIANGLHSGQSSGRFSRGVTVYYSCKDGFELVGNTSIRCSESGVWSRPLPRCEAIGCKIPKVQNGKVYKPQSTYKAGETLHFDCDAGYDADTDESRCQPGGTWEPVLACERVQPCPMPPEVTNGNHNSQGKANFTLGMSVTYTCNPGYYLVGNDIVFCRASGNWSRPVPRCEEVTCPRPPNIANGLHSGQSSGKFSQGVTVHYSCKDGFELVGNTSIRCSESGVWSRPLPRCEAIGCEIPEVQNGKVYKPQSTYKAGETLHFGCDAGYTTNTDESRCQPGGTWEPVLACERVRPCPMPPGVRNGNHNGQGKAFFTLGMSVTYTCDPGYYLVGNAVVFCRASGNWSRPVPRCEVSVCVNPDIDNGRQVDDRGLISAPGQTVTFQCHKGYSLQGSAQIFCQEDGSWHPPVPVCERLHRDQEVPNSLKSQGGCGAPTRLHFAELNEQHKNEIDFSVGKTVQYTCRPGYAKHPGMSPTITCLESGVWSEALEFCKKKKCNHPGEPANGKISFLTDLQFGSTVHYSCEEGHRLIGQSSRRCEISGRRVEWSGNVPICQRIPCEPPPDIPNGKHTGRLLDGFHFGTSVTYTCNAGYPLHGEPNIHCTTRDGQTGVWSGPPPQCGEARCPVPRVQNGRIVSPRTAYAHKDTVTFECEPGYVLRGHRAVQCQLNNTWEPPVPVCEQAGCNAPPSLAFAELKEPYDNQTIFPVGRTVNYVCRPGYTQHLGMPPAITCLENQTWSVALEFCKRKQCANPGDPENGRAVVLTDLLFGSKVNYTCNEGYKLVGGSQRTCEVSGTRVSWSGDAPVCQQVKCPPPPGIANGKASGQPSATHLPGSAVLYTCRDGYSLVGNGSIICTAAGTWSRPRPRCEATGCKRPEIQNGRTTGLETVYRVTDVVVFQCDFGYALKGSQESQCQFGGTWDPPVPICEKMLQCPSPPNIKNGQHASKDVKVFIPGISVKYYCDPGYVLTGKTTVSCLTSGTWSIPYPHCEVINCASPTIQNGDVAEGQSAVYPPGANVTFQCHPGFVLRGSNEAKCQLGGHWAPAVPTCEPALPCPPPPVIAHATHSAELGTNFTSGMSVSYSCNPGYLLVGEAQLNCTSSGAWSIPAPRCEGRLCPSPSAIDHGQHDGEDVKLFVPGKSVNYSCDPGYSLVGKTTLYCMVNGSWSIPYPWCEVTNCTNPTIQNGDVAEGQSAVYPPGANVTFQCHPGFVLRGSNEAKCQLGGHWAPAVPTCEPVLLQCPSPPNIDKGNHNSQDLEVFTAGMVVNYSCDPGYSLQGEASIYCTDSGNWSLPLPQCADTSWFQGGCGAPPNLTFAKLTEEYKNLTEFLVGDTVRYSCQLGYMRHPGISPTLTCLKNHTWSEALAFCKRKQCKYPETPKNGRVVVLTDLLFGSTVSHTCEDGHRLVGQSHRRCEIFGADVAWSGVLPLCQKVVCPAPQIQNGRVSGLKYHYTYNDTVRFKCRKGFTLRGHRTARCQADKTWHPPVPVCERDGVAEHYHHPDTTVKPVLRCSKPADITHGSLSGPAKAFFTPGASVRYICEPGFSLVGPASIYCTESGAWSHPPPVCQVVRCFHPPNITNGKLNGNISDTFSYGASVSYSCDPGYSLVGNASIKCTVSGAWSRPPPRCKEMRCVFPEVQGVKKAVQGNTYRSGTNVTLECDDGYTLEGISQIQCQEDLSWDPPVPACKLTSHKSGSVGLGVAAAGVLLLLGAGVVWKIISKQKEGYYNTHENCSYQTPLNETTEQKHSCLPQKAGHLCFC